MSAAAPCLPSCRLRAAQPRYQVAPSAANPPEHNATLITVSYKSCSPDDKKPACPKRRPQHGWTNRFAVNSEGRLLCRVPSDRLLGLGQGVTG